MRSSDCVLWLRCLPCAVQALLKYICVSVYVLLSYLSEFLRCFLVMLRFFAYALFSGSQVRGFSSPEGIELHNA